MENWRKIGCLTAAAVLVSCIVVSAAAAIYTQARNKPAQNTSAALNQPQSLQVELISPNEGENWPINSFIPVRAVAKSDERIAAVELWVDGKLFAAREDLNEHNLNIATGEWYWQPATQGTHTLLVRSVDTSGLTGFSKIVQIIAKEAAGSRQRVTPTDGQTLVEIADANGVGIEILQENNPGIDPNQSLSPEEGVFIPESAAPVKDIEISTQEPYSPPVSEEPDQGTNDWVSGFQKNIVDTFQNGSAATGDLLPGTPTVIKAELQGQCDATLEFKDNANNEDGNRIYRAMPGQSSFSMVADLPPYITKTIIHLDKKLNVKGSWMYYAAAYNTAGEAKSIPISINITDPGCYPVDTPPDSQPGDDFAPGMLSDDLVIISPAAVDMAYVYVTINGETRRIPQESYHFFQQGSGYTFDLAEYLLASVDNLPDATEYKIKVQLWGWKGGKPTLIEEYEKVITDFTRLLACLETTPGSCDKTDAVWSRKIYTWDPKNVKLRFKLLTLKKSTNISWGLFSDTLFGVNYKINSLEYPPTPGGNPVYFSDSFGPLYVDNGKDESLKYDWEKDSLPWQRNGFWRQHPSDKNFSVYYEALPKYYQSGETNGVTNQWEFHEKSNRVYIYNWPNQSQIYDTQTPFAPVWPDIYHVEFLDETYVEPQLPRSDRWGCIVYLEAADGHPTGYERCPAIYTDPCEDPMSWSCVEYTGLAALKQFADAYDWFAAKAGEVVSGISNTLIAIIPGCDGSETCKWIAKKTTELAWTYATGLPPQMPKSGQLAEEGIKSAISYGVGSAYDTVVDESGITDYLDESGASGLVPDPVKEWVGEKASMYKEKLVEGIYQQYMEAYRSRSGNSADACQDISFAHSNGYEPLCPDPNAAWIPAPGAQFVGPSIDVRITRKPLTENNNYGTDAASVNYLDLQMYALKVTNTTINKSRQGQVVPFLGGYAENYPENACNSCQPNPPGAPVCFFGYSGNIAIPCWYKMGASLQGSLYSDLEMPLPWLEPGKSVEMPLYFSQKTFWVPGHVNDIGKITDPEKVKADSGDDWNYLYYYGEQTFKAEEACRTNIPGKFFCGSSDEFSPPVQKP